MFVNEATGEVTATIGGEEFRLHATIERVGQLEGELGVPSSEIARRLDRVDVRTIKVALKAFCVSGNPESLAGMTFGKVWRPAVDALAATLAAAAPEPEAGDPKGRRKNAVAPRTKPRRGAAGKS